MIRRAIGMAVVGMSVFLGGGAASWAQVCMPPQCEAAPAPEARSGAGAASVPVVVVDDRAIAGEESSVLSHSRRGTGIPFLAAYTGLSIVALALVTIVAQRRAGPAARPQPVAKPRRATKSNDDWAAQILAQRRQRLDNTVPVLLGSGGEVAFGGHTYPPAGQLGGSDRA